jgi:uncharacterized protein
MAPLELILLAVALFLAGLIKGVSGLGYSSFALPVLVLTVDLSEAMALITFPVIASNLAVLTTLGGIGTALRRFWPLYLGLLPGTAGGVLLLAEIDRRWALQVLGFITLAYVGLAVLKSEWRLEVAWERAMKAPVGLMSGFITGLTGTQVIPLVPYFSSIPLEGRDQVQAINIAVTTGSFMLAAMLVWNGLMTRDLALVSIGGVAPAIAGVAIGSWLASRLSRQAFRGLMLSVLAVIALSLIIGRDLGLGVQPTMDTPFGRNGWPRSDAALPVTLENAPATLGARSKNSHSHSRDQG